MGFLQSDRATQLLLELVGAVRAWQFHLSDPERLPPAIERAGRVWARALAAGAPLELELRGGARFCTPGGAALTEAGASLDELAEQFERLGIHYLRADVGFEARELGELVAVLCATSARSDAEIEREVRERGARHVWLSPPVESAVRSGRSDSGCDARERAALTVQLVRALERLEYTDSEPEYDCLASQVEAAVDRLLRAGSAANAYRAALALARHCADPEDRGGSLAHAARARLRRLLEREELLAYTLTKACEVSGLASVQATQVLLQVGELAAPPLVESVLSRDAADGNQSAMIVLALGELALEPLLEQLVKGGGARARRAARLLGDLQHPRAVPALARALHGSSPELREAAASALAHIGTTAAIGALAQAIARARDATRATARTLIASLAQSPHPLALRTLCELAAGRTTHREPIVLDAIAALGRPGNTAAVETLSSVLGHRSLLARRADRPRRVAAARALGRIGGPEAERALAAHAGRAELKDVRRRALWERARNGRESP